MRHVPGVVVRLDTRRAAVARAILTNAGHEGQAHDVTGPESLTVGDVVNILSRVLNRPIQYVDVPEAGTGDWMVAKLGFAPVLAAALVETLGALRASRFSDVADSVRRLTGRDRRCYEAWCRENAEAFNNSFAA